VKEKESQIANLGPFAAGKDFFRVLRDHDHDLHCTLYTQLLKISRSLYRHMRPIWEDVLPYRGS